MGIARLCFGGTAVSVPLQSLLATQLGLAPPFSSSIFAPVLGPSGRTY